MTLEKKRSCIVLGGGGHAAALIESLRAEGIAEPVVLLDQDETTWGSELFGVPIPGGDDLLPGLIERGEIDCFTIGLGGVGDNGPRRRLFEKALDLGLAPLTVVHPTAMISPSATLGAGCQVLPRAVVHTSATIGANILVNTGAIIEHDCVIGGHVHIATGARLSGGVTVGQGAHIGVGASIRQGIRIGQNAIVAAGAAVVKDVPDNTVVGGVPAKELRRNAT